MERLSMLINRLIAPLIAAAIAVLMFGQVAHADLLIQVDKSAQRMTVTVNGKQLYDWPVSTGGRGYDTPSGTFKPFRMDIDHHSDESGTMRRCLIRYFLLRPATPCTAPMSSVILVVRCRTAAFGCR